jgi:hypothetical protein
MPPMSPIIADLTNSLRETPAPLDCVSPMPARLRDPGVVQHRLQIALRVVP